MPQFHVEALGYEEMKNPDAKVNIEGVNGVNRLATMGEKYDGLPTKREKKLRLQTGKILTDY